jgi:hypothetical protein
VLRLAISARDAEGFFCLDAELSLWFPDRGKPKESPYEGILVRNAQVTGAL